MIEKTFSFDYEQFNRLFPFYLLLDEELKIKGFGKTLDKIVPGLTIGKYFKDYFSFFRPHLAELTFETLKDPNLKLAIIETVENGKIKLRGQFEFLPVSNEVVFIGSVWFNSVDQIDSMNLNLNDFAVHDSQIDLLHVLKSQEIATDDTIQLLNTVNRQKKQLQTLSLIAEETINAAILTDAKGHIEWVNNAFEQITGYSLAEAKGKKPGHLLQGEETDEQTKNYLKQQIKNLQPFECEILNYSKDKKPYWVRINGKPLFDKTGKVTQFYALEENITKSKVESEKLGQTASRLEAVLTNFKAGILMEDETRHIVFTNREFCSIFKIPVAPNELVGADCSQAAEQSKHLFKEPYEFVKRINTLLKEKKVSLNEVLEMSDGRVLQRDFIPIFVGAKYMGHLWKYEDITERYLRDREIKLNEEKYRGILENMELGVIEVNNDGVITKLNRSFSEITGYSSEELLGEDPLKLLAADDISIKKVEVNTLQRKKGKTTIYEANVRKKDGTLLTLLISGGPIYDERNSVVGSIGIHLDISERKKLEAQLIEARKKAEASSIAKQEFLANMSHEMRTPLNAIIGLSNYMLLQKPEAEIGENLEILNFSANNLLALITDILDLSKIEAGKIEFVKSDFEIRQLIKGVCQTFITKSEEKGVVIDYNIDNNIPKYINGDSLRLTQVLNNLVHNAIKFTSKGKVHIDVWSIKNIDNKVKLRFEVTDTGIGIPENRLQSIFKAFEQADNQVYHTYGGTGLGLSISKKLIELQGGTIGISSQVNKGSTFYFELEAGVPGDVRQIMEAQDNREEGDYIKNKLILLVEDNVVNQRVAISYLKHWGAFVEVASNGEEALSKFANKKYDLLLVDLYMPVMDGFETIKRVRNTKKGKNVPIIALSASAEMSVMNKSFDCGASSFIAKPFNPTQLEAKLNELLRIPGKKSNSIAKISKGENVQKHKAAFSFIDLKRLKDSSLGSDDYVKEMLILISTEIELNIKEAKSLLSNGKLKDFADSIHKLKNSFLMIGLEKVRDDLNFLEENSRNNKKVTEIKSTFQNLLETSSKALNELKLAQKRMS